MFFCGGRLVGAGWWLDGLENEAGGWTLRGPTLRKDGSKLRSNYAQVKRNPRKSSDSRIRDEVEGRNHLPRRASNPTYHPYSLSLVATTNVSQGYLHDDTDRLRHYSMKNGKKCQLLPRRPLTAKRPLKNLRSHCPCAGMTMVVSVAGGLEG